MMMDPIADLLTRVKNAIHARSRKVDIPASSLKVSIVDIWKREGFIRNYKLYQADHKGILRIYLKYAGKEQSVIRGLKRISRPSQRVYTPHTKIPRVLGGLGMAIISTSKGVMHDVAARESRVGGEVLCTIW